MDRLGFKGAGMEPVKPPGDARRLARSDRIPLKARGPNDVWLLDLTQVKGLFGLQSFRIAAVLDAFSRVPLALRVFRCEPTADDVAGSAPGRRHRHWASPTSARREICPRSSLMRRFGLSWHVAIA